MNRVYVSLVGWRRRRAPTCSHPLVLFLYLPPVICVVGLMANRRRLILAFIAPRLPHGTVGWSAVRLARWPVAKTTRPSSLLSSHSYVASRCRRSRRCRPHPASHVVRAPLAMGLGELGRGLTAARSLCPGQPRAATLRWLSPFPALPGHAHARATSFLVRPGSRDGPGRPSSYRPFASLLRRAAETTRTRGLGLQRIRRTYVPVRRATSGYVRSAVS